MKLRVTITLAAIFGFLACQSPTSRSVELAEYVVDDLYIVRLPNTLSKTADLHDYASLQYSDPKSDFYVLGIYDEKEKLGRGGRNFKRSVYFRFVEQTVFEQADSTFIQSESEFKRDGISCKIADYFAHIRHFDDEYEVFYRIAIYETETHFFQFVIWMPYEGHCDRISWADSITYSFQLPQPPETPAVTTDPATDSEQPVSTK